MPQSLRGRLLLLIVFLVALPVLSAGYFLTIAVEQVLLTEKQQKLFGAAAILDTHLQGTYHSIIERHDLQNSSREIKIALLNRELRDISDQVARAYPGVGVGYYSKELDAILTYGPSEKYGEKVGLSISQTHEGRMVMASGQPRIQEGELVRGAIMNAMRPVIREGEVIGYIWANELTSHVQEQIGAMKRKIYIMLVLGLVIGMAGAAHVVDKLAADIASIKTGLARIKGDLGYKLPSIKGEVGEIVTAINDMVRSLAEHKKLEEQVQRTERLAAAGEVAASLAHEIRNPLMAIKGFAQLLKEETVQQETQEYTEIIIKETVRMNRLIEQLLYFSKPVADANARITDVSAILENTLILMETQIRRHHIAIIRSIDYHVPAVLIDEEQLKQVLVNIVINAIQAMDDYGTLRVGIKHCQAAREIYISIADSGSGIEPEQMKKLFHPFFTTKESGTGLGLSVAQRLISNWGGRILVDSVVGQGSTFSVVLPEAGGDLDGNKSDIDS